VPEVLREWIAAPPEWLSVVPDPLDLLEETRVLVAGEAAVAQEVEIDEAMERLIATGFRISQALLDDARAQVAARKSPI
jgi:hypothetical protein